MYRLWMHWDFFQESYVFRTEQAAKDWATNVLQMANLTKKVYPNSYEEAHDKGQANVEELICVG